MQPSQWEGLAKSGSSISHQKKKYIYIYIYGWGIDEGTCQDSIAIEILTQAGRPWRENFTL